MGRPYKDPRWIRKRKAILRRDGYLCRECKRYGRSAPADTVHHINPIELHPEWWLASWNLVSLCSACHNLMHDRITNELTDLGKEWVRRAKQVKPNED